MNKVDIANYALAMMGVNPIMAFTDDTKTAQIINQVYEPTVKECLSVHDWNFALKRVKLNQLATNDQSDFWQYAYQEPNDILKIARVRTINLQIIDKPDYEEIGNVIYSNANPVYLEYVYYEDGFEENSPPYFTKVVAYRLLMNIAIPLQGEPQLYSYCIKMYQDALAEARGLDSVRGTRKFVNNTQWLQGLM